MSLQFDIERLRIADMKLTNTTSLIQILDDEIMFYLNDFSGKILCDYSYLSDPPIFGDIGSFELDIKNNTFFFDTKANLTDDQIYILLDEVYWYSQGLGFNFDGISDLGLVVADAMNFFGGVITDRAVSLFQFVGVKKIEHIINTLIE